MISLSFASVSALVLHVASRSASLILRCDWMIKQLLFRANVTVFFIVAVGEHVRMEDDDDSADDSCRREDKEFESICFRWRGGRLTALLVHVVMVGSGWFIVGNVAL